MGEDVSSGSRGEFLTRVQRFTDEMLGSLTEGSKGKDADEKEARALRSNLLKALRIWDKALLEGQHEPRLEERLRQVDKLTSQVKTGEA